MMIYELLSPPFKQLRRYALQTVIVLPVIFPTSVILLASPTHAADNPAVPVIGSVINTLGGSTAAQNKATAAVKTLNTVNPVNIVSTIPKSTATYTVPYPSMGYTYINNKKQAVYNTFPAQPSLLFNTAPKVSTATAQALAATPMSAQAIADATGVGIVNTSNIAIPRNTNNNASNNIKAIVGTAAVVGIVALIANNWNYNVAQPTYKQIFPTVPLPSLPSLQGCMPAACPTVNNTVATHAASIENPFVIHNNTMIPTRGISPTVATQIATTADVCQGTGCAVATPVTMSTLERSGNRTLADLNDCQGTGCAGSVTSETYGTYGNSMNSSNNNSSNNNSSNNNSSNNNSSNSYSGNTNAGSTSSTDTSLTDGTRTNSTNSTVSTTSSSTATTTDGKYKWPVGTTGAGTANYVSSPFGQRDRSNFNENCHVHPDSSTHCGVHAHNGLDLKTAVGTPIESMSSGKVVWVDPYCKNPNAKLAQNKDPEKAVPKGGCSVSVMNDKGEMVSYLHLSEAKGLKVGDAINAGDSIGKAGNSGSSSGAHLHLSVCDADAAKVEAKVKAKKDPSLCSTVGGKPINPLDRMDNTDPRYDSGKAKEKIATEYLQCKGKAEKSKKFEDAAACRKTFIAKNSKVDASRAAGSSTKSNSAGASSSPAYKDKPQMDGLNLKRL